MRTSSRPGLLCRALAGLYAAGLGLALANTAHAGPIPEFTGYTRIGLPSGDLKVEKIGGAAPKDVRPLGVTVYYTVLDQRGSGRRGGPGDLFGTGIKDFDSLFQAGRELDRARFDTDARYLYLYQVVNDSGREAAVKSVSVRLIIDPRFITSWGFFGEKRRTDKGQLVRRGLGFTSTFPVQGAKAADDQGLIRPISTEFPAVTDRRYLSPAPAIKSERTYGFAPITLGERPAPVGADVGSEPESVYLVSNAYFGEDISSPYLKPSLPSDTDTLPAIDDARVRSRMVNQWRTRFPAVRAVWSDEDAVRPRERSTVWGFTSDYPPTLEIASVTSRAIGIEAGDGKAIPAIGDDKKGMEKKGAEKKADKKDGEGLGPIGPVAGAGALDLARTGLPLATGMLPTPMMPVAATTAAPVEGAASIPMAGTLGPTFGGALGGQPGGGLGGGALGVGGGSAPFLAGRGSGAGGGIGGGSGGGGAAVGGFGGGQTGVSDSGSATGQGENQNQRQGNTLTNTVNVNVRQDQAQQQKQQQQQQQGQSQSQHGGPPGTVVPAPPAWLLGLLGLPAFAFFARRRKAQATDATLEAKADEPPAA